MIALFGARKVKTCRNNSNKEDLKSEPEFMLDSAVLNLHLVGLSECVVGKKNIVHLTYAKKNVQPVFTGRVPQF